MEEKNNSKPKYFLYILLITVMVVSVVGLTFAFFAPGVTRPNGDKNANVVTGKLNIEFSTSEYISNSKMMLVKDSESASKSEKTVFSVKHATGSNVKAKYDLYISSIAITNNFKSADFKWELIKDNTTIASGNFASIGSATEIKLTSTAVDLNLADTHNYELRMWLSETDVDQSSLYSGSFNGKVKIEAVNAPAS